MNIINIQIAWRNVWRNKLRSSVVIMAVTVGIFGGLASVGVMKGIVEDLVSNTLNTETSHIQIHNPKFTDNNEIKYVISEIDKKISILESDTNITAICERTKTFAMASTASTGTGIMINGINTEKEKSVSILSSKLDSTSSWFETKTRNPIIVSKRLAKKLNVKLKSKIILTFQNMEGNLSGASFKVIGIYKTTNSMFDDLNVFVKKSDIDKLIDMPENSAHEIAIMTNDFSKAAEYILPLKNKFPDVLIEDWSEINPILKMTSSMTAFMLYIFMSIILLALGFAIVNTMLMVILERTKELGMIMAIGMNRRKVFAMIMYETVFLSIVGGGMGILITIIFTWYFGSRGIDVSSVADGFESVGYSSILYPKLDVLDYIQVTILVLITGIIASIFPAVRALKMKPAEAVRD